MNTGLAKGSLLVAAPALSDPNFSRSVVLLCDYGPEGAMGLIVNRPLPLPLSEILPEEFRIPAGKPRVFQGGPVHPDHLLFLHGIAGPGLDAHPVCPSIWLGGDPEVLKRALAAAKGPLPLRAFLGYAGWGAGQLEAEIAEGAWALRPGTAREVFAAETDGLWDRLLGTTAKPDPLAEPRGPELN